MGPHMGSKVGVAVSALLALSAKLANQAKHAINQATGGEECLLLLDLVGLGPEAGAGAGIVAVVVTAAATG